MLALGGGRGEPAADRPAFKQPLLRSVCPGHTASPSSSPPGQEEDAVCCMCGDHGLPGQLFRCKSCRVRTQHSYCSELYPRATAYKRCNWCLRETPSSQGGAGAAGHASAVSTTGNNSKPSGARETKRKAAATTTAPDEERHNQRRHEGCSSRRLPAEPGCPVKKKRISKADDERAVRTGQAGVKAGSCDDANAAAAGESSRELMRAGKPRVKVRRYKLLAEVISC